MPTPATPGAGDQKESVVKKLPFKARPRVVAAVGVVGLVAIVLIARGLSGRSAAATEIPVEPVERRDIALTIEATGTIEPIDMIEVKSKASGQIVAMPVQIGSNVRAGELLAQI